MGCMKIRVLFTGKTTERFVAEGVEHFAGRMKRYLPFTVEVVPAVKGKMDVQRQKEKEGEAILRAVGRDAYVVLLDERGDALDSVSFARFMQDRMNASTREMVFVVGGPYGVSRAVFARADRVLQLSAMTFSHQVVRILLMEQLYRAMTIVHGEPYHHA